MQMIDEKSNIYRDLHKGRNGYYETLKYYSKCYFNSMKS